MFETSNHLSDRVQKIFDLFKANSPDPHTELYSVNPFTFLVAVMLSAQTTDKSVNKVTQYLFEIAKTPQEMVDLGIEEITRMIQTIGLYRTKAKNLVALSQKLICEYGGEVSPHREALESLPGVGRKTANVVLNAIFGELTIPVDTHVFRVAHRLELSDGKTPKDVEQDLLSIIPMSYRKHAHIWLVLHGRYICQARRPKCGECFLKNVCPSMHLFL